MKLTDCNIKLRCEMPNCKEMAQFKLMKTGFIKNAGLFLCKDCVKEMYKAIGECIVPKSPGNMLNKKITTKRIKEVDNG